MNEADARKLVNDFARAVVYGEDADILRTGAALEAALTASQSEPLGILRRGDGGSFRLIWPENLLPIYAMPEGEHKLYAAPPARQQPAIQAAVDALQVAIDAWGQTESPPSVIKATRETLRTALGLPSIGQVVEAIRDERLQIERARGLGDPVDPCPFCGSKNVELICSGSAWFVECRECQATGPMLVDGEDRDSVRAVELWAIPPRTK